MRYRWTATTLAAAATVLALAGCHTNDVSSAATSTPSVVVTKSAPAPHIQPSETSTVDSGAADDAGTPEAAQSPARVEGRPVTAAPAPTGQRGVNASVFFGTWTRHASHLELTSDLTGTLVMGSGAVDVESWTVTWWSPKQNEISMTLGSQISKTGDGVDGLYSGKTVTGELSTSAHGGSTLMTTGLGSTGGPLTWCNASSAGTPECGA
ncbi:SPOR domain-containing protein [Gordonia sputi]